MFDIQPSVKVIFNVDRDENGSHRDGVVHDH
jgi:hypothetical protein